MQSYWWISKYFANWNRTDAQNYELYNSINIQLGKLQKYRNQNHICGCKSPGLKIIRYKGSWRKFCDKENFQCLDFGCGLYKFIKAHQQYYKNFKSINMKKIGKINMNLKPMLISLNLYPAIFYELMDELFLFLLIFPVTCLLNNFLCIK